MQVIKVYSFTIDSIKRRIVKFLRFGLNDVQTAIESAGPGVDAAPIKDMVALYAESSIKGEVFIIGYINKNQLAGPGEIRLYSQDSNGNQKFYTWMKSNGTYELGGTADNSVRYSPLNSGLSNFKTEIQAELIKIQAAISALGGAYTPGTLSIDISEAKINEIKTL